MPFHRVMSRGGGLPPTILRQCKDLTSHERQFLAIYDESQLRALEEWALWYAVTGDYDMFEHGLPTQMTSEQKQRGFEIEKQLHAAGHKWPERPHWKKRIPQRWP